MTKRAILWGAAASAFLPSVTIGCVGQDSSPPASATSDVISVAFGVAAAASLPQCTSALAGTVAHVDSPPGLSRCSSGKWSQISCDTSGGGTVAYASSPPTLWACVHSQWTEVALPDAGPPGPRGPAGPQGAPGEAGITPTITVTPEPAGHNCAAGGIRVDVDSDGTLSTSYVCNGVSAGGSDAGLDASDGEAGLNAIQQYALQYGEAYCTGLGKCCPGYDAGAFDQTACANAWTTSGWEFTLPPNSVVYARNNLLFNKAAGAGCIAALENFACTPPSGTPLTDATQYAAVTNACLGVLTGTIANGVGGCLSSFECARGYCDLPSDGGAGTCTALVGTGATCVPGNDSPDQMCSQAGEFVPPLWCNLLAGGSSGTCATPLADGVACYNATTGYWDDQGCSSLMCGDNGCGGTTTYPLAGFCANWAPADAGGD